MDTEIKERIAYYLGLYGELREQCGSSEVAIAVLQQLGKDTRMAKIQNWEKRNDENGTNGDMPATTKQLAFMRKLGLDIPTSVTKKEASALIDEEKRNREAA